jgi:hypothetical protein
VPSASRVLLGCRRPGGQTSGLARWGVRLAAVAVGRATDRPAGKCDRLCVCRAQPGEIDLKNGRHLFRSPWFVLNFDARLVSCSRITRLTEAMALKPGLAGCWSGLAVRGFTLVALQLDRLCLQEALDSPKDTACKRSLSKSLPPASARSQFAAVIAAGFQVRPAGASYRRCAAADV